MQECLLSSCKLHWPLERSWCSPSLSSRKLPPNNNTKCTPFPPPKNRPILHICAHDHVRVVTSMWSGKGSHCTDLRCSGILLQQELDLESQERDRERKAPKYWGGQGKANLEISLRSLMLWLKQAPSILTSQLQCQPHPEQSIKSSEIFRKFSFIRLRDNSIYTVGDSQYHGFCFTDVDKSSLESNYRGYCSYKSYPISMSALWEVKETPTCYTYTTSPHKHTHIHSICWYHKQCICKRLWYTSLILDREEMWDDCVHSWTFYTIWAMVK